MVKKEINELDDSIGVSSDRIKLLNRIESLQDAFFEKRNEYELAKLKKPGSEECKVLFSECCRIHDKSDKLISLL